MGVHPRRGYAQQAVFDALDGFQGIGQLLDSLGNSPDRHDLQATVMVEVDVLGGDDERLVVVLEVGDPVQQRPPVVVEDEGDGAGHLLVLLPLPLDQFLADQVAESLRAVRIILSFDQPVELFQQGFLDGNPESDEIRHNDTPEFTPYVGHMMEFVFVDNPSIPANPGYCIT